MAKYTVEWQHGGTKEWHIHKSYIFLKRALSEAAILCGSTITVDKWRVCRKDDSSPIVEISKA